MTEGHDLIAAAVLMDDLFLPDGSQRLGVPGGAGLYALAGAALFSRQALLVTGTGCDLPSTFGPWMDRNGLSMAGLRLSEEHTPRNRLHYASEMQRVESPIFGADHFARIEPTPDDIAMVAQGARSLYLFRNTDATFWNGIADLDRDGLTVLWEIAIDACSPDLWPDIADRLRWVDALSINLVEAGLILSETDAHRIVAALGAWPVPVAFLRVGKAGSYAITEREVTFVPGLPVEPVDVTGGGNAYGGAALVGLATDRSPAMAARMGTCAASLAIGQHGPHDPASPVVQATVQRLLDRTCRGIDA